VVVLNCKLFADDAKLYLYISIDDTAVCLQRSHDKLSARASEWQLAINIDNVNLRFCLWPRRPQLHRSYTL
jgi:hypothetical protein